MKLHICVPVLRRYDLLKDLLWSLTRSEVKPNKVWVINNGRDKPQMDQVMDLPTDIWIEEIVPDRPWGVAQSWNWFIDNVPEERIITNDDILFAPHSLEVLSTIEGDIVFGYGYSCYLIRDSCVAKVGKFDESISPGYAYFEDWDYEQRIIRAGNVIKVEAQGTDLRHIGSQTWQSGSPAEIAEHWRRYNIAMLNFLKKWGPGNEHSDKIIMELRMRGDAEARGILKEAGL